MPISVDWVARLITIPQDYCTHIDGGTLFELDTDQLRQDLKSLEDDESGIIYPDTHRHNSPVTVAGVTLAQVIEIVNGYRVEFVPDEAWTVRLSGSNNNIFDAETVLVQNHVQVIAQNSAGLIVYYSGGGGATPSEVAQAVWEESDATGGDGTMGGRLRKTLTLAKFIGLK